MSKGEGVIVWNPLFCRQTGRQPWWNQFTPTSSLAGYITITREFKESKTETGIIQFLPTVCSAIASACALSSSSILMSGIRASLTAGATTSVSSCRSYKRHQYKYSSRNHERQNTVWMDCKVWVWVYWCFTSHATIFQSYMRRHRCAGGLKKKLYLRSGSQRHRYFTRFFNVCVLHRHGTTLFIQWFQHTDPFSRLLRHAGDTEDVFWT